MQVVAPHQTLSMDAPVTGVFVKGDMRRHAQVYGMKFVRGQQHWRRIAERTRHESTESCAKSLPLRRGTLTLTLTLSTTPHLAAWKMSVSRSTGGASSRARALSGPLALGSCTTPHAPDACSALSISSGPASARTIAW